MTRLALAPMIDKTEPRFRYLIRQLFPEIWLYTEMISSGAIINGKCRYFLRLHPCEEPIAMQLGTHCPEEAYRAVVIVRHFCAEQSQHFAEYNLNAGCPSERVQSRNIGAILMQNAPLLADILTAMGQALRDTQNLFPERTLPQVTLKHRLGIEQNSKGIARWQPKQLYSFLQQVAPHCERLIVHARVAILDGLSPKQNREIPPLNYPLVFKLRQMFHPLAVELNGALRHYEQISAVWPYVDGVMLGRMSFENTWELFRIRQRLRASGFLNPLPAHPPVSGVQSRAELVGLYVNYLEQHPSAQSIAAQVWPLLGLWQRRPEARRWRRLLSPPYPAASISAPELARQAQQLMWQLQQKYAEQDIWTP